MKPRSLLRRDLLRLLRGLLGRLLGGLRLLDGDSTQSRSDAIQSRSDVIQSRPDAIQSRSDAIQSRFSGLRSTASIKTLRVLTLAVDRELQNTAGFNARGRPRASKHCSDAIQSRLDATQSRSDAIQSRADAIRSRSERLNRARTVAILAQGTTSGDALCAALFCLSLVRTPGRVILSISLFLCSFLHSTRFTACVFADGHTSLRTPDPI